MEIDPDELARSNEELERFVEEHSENHVEIKMLVNGYRILYDDGEELVLDPLKLIRVFEYDRQQKFQIAYEVAEIWTLLLAFVFDSPMGYVFRFSFGSGTLFPRQFAPESDGYMMSMLMFRDDLSGDWKRKTESFLQYADYFTERKEKALPFLWYGKGVCSNDRISSFLNFYRSLELLAREHTRNRTKKIRDLAKGKFLVDTANPELGAIYDSVLIPRKHMMSLFFEEMDIVDKSVYENWRATRNKLTHGDWDLEFDRSFFDEVSNIGKKAKAALEMKLQGYGIQFQ